MWTLCDSSVIVLYIFDSVYFHYGDVIMGAMASEITSLTVVYLVVYSGEDQRKHQSSASLAFVRGIHRWPRVNERLSKQSRGWWFETPSRSLWRHCNDAQCSSYHHPNEITDSVAIHALFWYVVMWRISQTYDQYVSNRAETLHYSFCAYAVFKARSNRASFWNDVSFECFMEQNAGNLDRKHSVTMTNIFLW